MSDRLPPKGASEDLMQRGAALVEQARRLVPLIESAADRIERDRVIPPEVLSALHDARLFRMLLPRSYDGEELDPATFFQVMETIATADASVAWCIGQGSGVSMAAAYLKPEVARTVFGDDRAVAASGPSQRDARAVIVDGGYRVSGHWSFASGSRHAQWLGGHCTVCERDGSPRLGPNGKPLEQRTMLFPKARAAMTDVWQVMGLKGTGSDNYSVTDLFVPEDFSFTRESDDDRRERGPLYRFSIFNMFGVAFSGVALGIARKVLDDFIRLAKEKTPASSATLLRDNGVIQSQVGLSEARLQSARIYVIDTFRRLYEHAASGSGFTHEQRVANRIVTCHAIHQAREVVNFAYHAAGATAIFERNPFERRFRDFHTVTQQGQAHFANFELLGQALLGVTPNKRL
jgi:alkylation response protein AidB-like acyl-CoA dehydrogenase